MVNNLNEEFVKRVINNRNIYKLFVNFIADKYPNNLNVLDVGSGRGTTSCLLSKMGYKVSAMDLFSKYELDRFERYDVKVLNEYFELDTDISSYDLITGFHCCGAIEKIIVNSIKNSKEFVVTICETRNGLYQDNIMNKREDYINYLMKIDNNIKRIDLPIYVDSECWGHTLYLKREIS